MYSLVNLFVDGLAEASYPEVRLGINGFGGFENSLQDIANFLMFNDQNRVFIYIIHLFYLYLLYMNSMDLHLLRSQY